MEIMVKMGKKGVLFTLGITFFMLVFLALAVLIFHNAQKSEEITSKLAAIDRVYDLHTSIEQSLKDIFNLKSGIIINATGSSIIFEEQLPNPNSGSFNSSMSSFKGFVESNINNVNLTIEGILIQMPLTIMPYNITYKHINFGGREVNVIPEELNFNGYSIFMGINKNVTSCSFDTKAGSFNLSVEIVGENGEGCSNMIMIDPSEGNEVRVNDGEIEIDVEDNTLAVKIDDESGINADLRAGILADTYSAYAVYEPSVITIDFNELGIYKEGKARLS